MLKHASLIGVVVALVAPVGASAATTHDSFDVTGTVFECPTHKIGRASCRERV